MAAAGRVCSFISRVGPSQQDSDVDDIEADRSRQVPVSESSPEQSYDLERDLSTILSAETRTGANMPPKIPQNTTFCRPISPYLYVTLFHLAPVLTSLIVLRHGTPRHATARRGTGSQAHVGRVLDTPTSFRGTAHRGTPRHATARRGTGP